MKARKVAMLPLQLKTQQINTVNTCKIKLLMFSVMTFRLLSGSTGWNKQQNSNSALLDKLFTSILVEPLSRTELSKVK